MVRDRQLRSTDFLAICRQRLAGERDTDILSTVIDRVAMTLVRFVPEDMLEREAHEFFATALDNLERVPAGDTKTLWARAAIAVAADAADVHRLTELADGRVQVADFTLDQEMRWAIAVKAVALGLADGEERLSREGERDRSDRGQRAVLKATAARPTAASKEEVWQRIHGEGYGSFHFTRAAMQGFFWPQQADLVEPYVPRFFAEVERIFETRDNSFARAYMLAMYPAYRADEHVLQRTQTMLAGLDGSLPTLSRQLAESADELERSIKVRAFAAE
jgi:aminopeptidase N